MKTIFTILPLVASMAACVGPSYKTHGDYSVGSTAVVEINPEYELFRTKEKISPPYYKDCLVASESVITENVVEAYQNSIEQALTQAGVQVVDNANDADSIITVDLLIRGNGDYGSLRFYTELHTESANGGKMTQKELVKFDTFKAMKYMPKGLGKYARNDYCTDLWAQGGDAVSSDLNSFMNGLADYHVSELEQKGALYR